MHQADGHLGNPLLQCFGIGHRRLPLVLPFFGFDERTDDVHLSPFLHLFLDEGIQPGAIAGGHGIGLHPFASRGKFVQHRHLQIAVEHQGQGAGNGGGAHHKRMGVRPLVPQKLPLLHAEAVLFIGNGQGRTAKDHIVFDEGMGADENRDLPLT